MKQLIASTLLVAAMLLQGTANAKPVGGDKTSLAARNFWSAMVDAKSANLLQDHSAEWQYADLRLYTSPTGGFVIVAADDEVRPILAYSPTDTFDPANLPPMVEYWLQTYQQQIDWMRENDGEPYPDVAERWQRLLAGNPGLKDGSEVEPLLSTQWDQWGPYNELCPEGTVTGCAATAQAQFMKFWNHPAFGSGSHSYTAGSYGLQSADFAHTIYDWDNMTDMPTDSSSDVERLAVATLMYHCGVSLEMSYGTAAQGGSSALGLVGDSGWASIDNSLKYNFYYSHDMRVAFRNYGYTDARWSDLLSGELGLGHPIVYTGAAEQGGHGFICDGMQTVTNLNGSTKMFHFNFGWSGIGDGYYTIDSISPGHGGAGGNVTYTFNLNNAALIGAVPVYALRVSDTIFNFTAEGGSDSLLVAPDASLDGVAMQVVSSEPWLTVDSIVADRAGWVRFTAAPNVSGAERTATLTFIQGQQRVNVKMVQIDLDSTDMCPLTVIMEATRGNGWQGGANLQLMTAEGYIFGTAQLAEGYKDSVDILVGPHDIYSVWNSGGGTDRYVNYYVRNRHGDTVVAAEYAYRTGGIHFIEWPCARLAVDEVETDGVSIASSDGRIVVSGTSQPVAVYDIMGRQLSGKQGVFAVPARGVYIVKIGNLPARKVVVVR